MNTHQVPFRQMTYTKKKKGPQEVIKNTVPKNKRKKGQQYTHKPNFDYQVETEDNEHEPHQESG